MITQAAVKLAAAPILAAMFVAAAIAPQTLVAQGTQAAPAQPAQVTVTPPPRKPTVYVPVKVTVVIARYSGDKKTSSLPFMMFVNAAEGVSTGPSTSLRMGSDVPVPTVTVQTSQTAAAPVNSVSYRSIGTNLDCAAAIGDDGNIRLSLTVSDTQIFSDVNVNSPSQPIAIRGLPQFQSFQSSSNLILKDGQTVQFTTASDKANGEQVRVEVTVNLVK